MNYKYRFGGPSELYTEHFETVSQGQDTATSRDPKKNSTSLEVFADGSSPPQLYKERRWSFETAKIDMIIRFPVTWNFCPGFILLPAENIWPQELRCFLYLMFLFYLFLGVAIIADIFMSGIEKITSEKPKMVKDDAGNMIPELTKTGEPVMVKVWNETVANLTLLALGSSAPEILLSLSETVGNLENEPGELGPSTIVGSAAFNLMCITGVCMFSMPATMEGAKKVDQFGVFAITSFFSIWAYVWLLLVLTVITPNVVDTWEAVMTFLQFPILVLVCYCQDRNWFRPSGQVADVSLMPTETASDDILRKEINDAKTMLIKVNDEEVDEEAIAREVAAKHRPNLNRGHYRCNATRMMVGKAPCIAGALSVESEFPMTPGRKGNPDMCGEIQFSSPTYVCSEGDGHITLDVIRTRSYFGKITAKYQTQDLTAKKGKHYEYTSGELVFEEGERAKSFRIPIIDDSKRNQNRTLTVKLDCTPTQAIGQVSHAVVTIEDDDLPGDVTFMEPFIVVAESKKTARIAVTRENGTTGTILAHFHTEEGEGDDKANDGQDYDGVQNGTIEFQHTEKTKWIDVKIIDDMDYSEKTEHFFVVLTAVEMLSAGPARDDPASAVGASPSLGSLSPKLGRLPRIRVDITNDKEHHSMVDRIKDRVKTSMDVNKAMMSESWQQQFRDAFSLGGDGDEVPIAGYVMHFLTFLWKVIFALVPPPEKGGGWACFGIALGFIACLTILIEQTATLVGCTMGLDPKVTAITFVALGTSLPDTFASKQAAQEEETADMAIGNVTGSNSVNVFLGLGLPWLVAAIYYEAKGWCFIVPAGDLGVSVSIFCICGVLCLGTLFVLRLCHPQKAELGGPLKTPLTVFFVSLWFLYVIMSAMQVYHPFWPVNDIKCLPVDKASCGDGKCPNTGIRKNYHSVYSPEGRCLDPDWNAIDSKVCTDHII